MATLEQIAQQAALNGGHKKDFGERQPVPQYNNRQFEYFSNATHLFREQYLEYASDFFEAEIQNWDRGGEWEAVYIRMADVVRPSAAIQRHFDQYKMVIPRDPSINYLQPGTKIRAMGSYWIVVNPINISGGEGSGIVQRCNAVWNYLDWYGNIVSEPIIVENARANASAPDSQTDQRIATGYYNVTCQYNEFTRQVNDNTRLILGSKAYQVTGYGDFDTEFTGDYGSVRLLSFAIRVLTQNDETDDMENHVAGGKAFSFDSIIDGPGQRAIGKTADYSVRSIRNGSAVSATDIHPLTWLFSSTNPSILTVTSEGHAAGQAEGIAFVKAVLKENSSIERRISVRVEDTESQTGVRFTSRLPSSMEPYQSWTISAAYFDERGNETDDAVTFLLSGAEPGSYSYDVDGNTLTVRCFGYSDEPLTIEASCNGTTSYATVILNNF